MSTEGETEPDQTQAFISQQIRSNPYPDLPLSEPRKQVRLLQLLPGGFDDQICCELDVFPLQETPPDEAGYEALSYVWGPFSDKSIRLNGIDGYEITDNLEAALRRLRKPDQSRRLWIDAICIKQTNPVERSAQVAIMRDVYRYARTVTVWLGEPFPGTVSTLAFADWSIVVSLTMRGELAWWRRMWTVQEAAVAKEIFVQYGKLVMPWETLVEIFKKIPEDLVNASERSDTGISQDSEKMNEALLNARNALSAIEQLQAEELPKSTLRDWLLKTEARVATDPRDKIFGILGLLQEPLEDSFPTITPDYKRSLGEVYTEAVNVIANQEGTLDILTDGWPRDLDHCPWISRFCVHRQRQDSNSTATDGEHLVRHRLRFWSSMNAKPIITLGKPSSTSDNSSNGVLRPPRLGVYGLHVDQVCAVSQQKTSSWMGRHFRPSRYKLRFLRILEELKELSGKSASSNGIVPNSELVNRLGRVHVRHGRIADYFEQLGWYTYDIYYAATLLVELLQAELQLLEEVESERLKALYKLKTTSEIAAKTHVLGTAAQMATLSKKSKNVLGDFWEDLRKDMKSTTLHPVPSESFNLDLWVVPGRECYLNAFCASRNPDPERQHLRVNLNGSLGVREGKFDPFGKNFMRSATGIRLQDRSKLVAELHWQTDDGEMKSRESSIDLRYFVSFMNLPSSVPSNHKDDYIKWSRARIPLECSLYHRFGFILADDLKVIMSQRDDARDIMEQFPYPWDPHAVEVRSLWSAIRSWPSCVNAARSFESRLHLWHESLLDKRVPHAGWLLEWFHQFFDNFMPQLPPKENILSAFEYDERVRRTSPSCVWSWLREFVDSQREDEFSTFATDIYVQNVYLNSEEEVLRRQRVPSKKRLDRLDGPRKRIVELFLELESFRDDSFVISDDLDERLADTKLFCTTTELIGFGPADTKAGDEVAIALGARMPYILRGNGDVTELIGETYVDGLMNGEMVKLQESFPNDYPLVDLVKDPARR